MSSIDIVTPQRSLLVLKPTGLEKPGKRYP
jgi:hypothetical protein